MGEEGGATVEQGWGTATAAAHGAGERPQRRRPWRRETVARCGLWRNRRGRGKGGGDGEGREMEDGGGGGGGLGGDGGAEKEGARRSTEKVAEVENKGAVVAFGNTVEEMAVAVAEGWGATVEQRKKGCGGRRRRWLRWRTRERRWCSATQWRRWRWREVGAGATVALGLGDRSGRTRAETKEMEGEAVELTVAKGGRCSTETKEMKRATKAAGTVTRGREMQGRSGCRRWSRRGRKRGGRRRRWSRQSSEVEGKQRWGRRRPVLALDGDLGEDGEEERGAVTEGLGARRGRRRWHGTLPVPCAGLRRARWRARRRCAPHAIRHARGLVRPHPLFFFF